MKMLQNAETFSFFKGLTKKMQNLETPVSRSPDRSLETPVSRSPDSENTTKSHHGISQLGLGWAPY